MDKGILRVVDANFNRCREGLRVAEDILRFIIVDDRMRRKVRSLRHALDKIAREQIIKKAVLARDSRKDIGRKTDCLELKRNDVKELLYINIQRAKESLRVLEEFFKLILPAKVADIKRLRYEVYAFEKAVLLKWYS